MGAESRVPSGVTSTFRNDEVGVNNVTVRFGRSLEGDNVELKKKTG